MAEFLQDHNVAYLLSTLLSTAGHKTRTARDLRLTRTPDDELLAIAARNGWTLITHNAEDFTLLHRAWRRWAAEWKLQPPPAHAGILVLPHPFSAAVASRMILGPVDAGVDLTNRLYTLKRKAREAEWVEDTGQAV